MTAAKLKLTLVAGVLGAGAAAVLLVTRGRPAPVDEPPPPADAAPRPVPPEPAAAAEPPAPPTDAQPLPADYDPNQLLAGGANPVELFLKEPRNPAWAPQVEKVIGKHISQDLEHLMPEAQGMGMSCHTLGCVVIVGAPPEHLAKVVIATKLVTLGPTTIDLPPDEKGRARWLFFTERRFASAQAFTTWYEETRKRTLAAIKAGERTNPFSVPVDQLPAD